MVLLDFLPLSCTSSSKNTNNHIKKESARYNTICNMSFEPLPLPEGVSEDYVDCTSSCGLNFHILKAGETDKPLVLFCHGYPELAFSWRKILPAVAKAGYYCVAMDQRGYGRTTGWEDKPYHEVDLTQYTMTNLVRDLVCLTYRLGYTDVACR